MGVKTDRFKKAFTGNVSDKMLASRVQKAQAEIARLKTNIQALTQAGIGAEVYQRQVPVLEKQQTDALKGTTNEAKYEALEQVKLTARERADAAAEALHNRPNQTTVTNLKQLIVSDGVGALDDRVRDIGSKCKKPADRKQMLAIIEARWGLSNINGDLDSKTLPRLYECFKMVPEDHLKGNTSLKEIRRDANPPDGEASFYKGEQEKLIVLNLGSDGEWHDPDHTITSDSGVKHKTSYFNHTTLHEIGHAVDDRLKYMKTNGKNANRGGWKQEFPDSIAPVAAREKGFYDAFPTLPKPLLAHYLKEVLSSGTASPQPGKWAQAKRVGDSGVTVEELTGNAGIQQAEQKRAEYDQDEWPADGTPDIDNEVNAARSTAMKTLKAAKLMAAYTTIDKILRNRLPMDSAADETIAESPAAIPDENLWNQLAAHDAVKWCQSVRLKGKADGVWEGGASAAAAATLGGRIYQQAYSDGRWNSYASRAESISNYQFRADGEWFAELYAAAFLGWLGDNHWIKQLQMPPV